jgi:hypothetical protein
MGCAASLGTGATKVADHKSVAMAKGGSPLTPEEIQSRIECSEKAARLRLTKSLQIEYAFVSQRGYYPDGKIGFL